MKKKQNNLKKRNNKTNCIHLYFKKINNNIFIKIFEFIIFALTIIKLKKKKLKIGVVGIGHGPNIGNNLVKYSIFMKLTELGYDPYIIGNLRKNTNISFMNKSLKLYLIKNNYSEIKRKDFDILMVNSDQTWRRRDPKFFYDYAFLKFAKNWAIPKFIYGASLGAHSWIFTKKDEKIAKECLKTFNGISIRENGTIKLIEKHLGIKPLLVLDPTLLIDKKYYLNIIQNYKSIQKDGKYICIYLIFSNKNIKKFIKNSSKKLGYKIKKVSMFSQNHIEEFIYGISNSKAVITNSYHGTIFSIIFKKPFVTFIKKTLSVERFYSLRDIFHLENRIYYINEIPNINLLTTPLNINLNLINSLKKKSLYFLKQNLKIK